MGNSIFKFKGIEIPGFEVMTTEEKIEAKRKILRQIREAKENAAAKELYEMVKEHCEDEGEDFGYKN